MTTTVQTSTEKREQYVRQLLALAAFIEEHPELPVPDAITVQKSVFGTMAEQENTVTAAAVALDKKVEVRDRDGADSLTTQYCHPAGFTYIVYAYTGHAVDFQRETPEESAAIADAAVTA